MCNIAVLVSAFGSNLASLIDAINSGKINGSITAVISNNFDSYALERAKQNNIPTYFIKNNPQRLLEVLTEASTDLIVLAGYLPILPIEVVRHYKNKIINVPPSLIPKFCGKGFYGIHVHEAVLAAKETTTGATVHYVDSGIDTGPIILQKEVSVFDDDTPETLQQRVLLAEHEILVNVTMKLCKEEK